MRELFGCARSPGTLARSVSECAHELVETELKIKRKLRRAGVIHADETGLRVEEKYHYVHVVLEVKREVDEARAQSHDRLTDECVELLTTNYEEMSGRGWRPTRHP